MIDINVDEILQLTNQGQKKRKVSQYNGEFVNLFNFEINATGDFPMSDNYHVTLDSHFHLDYQKGHINVKAIQLKGRRILMFRIRYDQNLSKELHLVNCASNQGLISKKFLDIDIKDGSISVSIRFSIDIKIDMSISYRRESIRKLITYFFQFDEKKVSSDLFYKCIVDNTQQNIPSTQEFDVPELDTDLLKFQKKTVNWLLQQENVKYDPHSNRCKPIPFKTEITKDNILNLVNKLWYGWKLIEKDNQYFYVNLLSFALATYDQLRAYVEDYQNDPDKNNFPESLPGKGLLCEEMGLGKTVEITSLILLNQRPTDQIDQKFDMKVNAYNDMKSIVKGRTTLIIAPDSILKQWQNEIVHLAPSLAITEYKGIGGYESFRNDPTIVAAYLRKFDVVFTTYSTIARELDYAKYSSKVKRTRNANKRSYYEFDQWGIDIYSETEQDEEEKEELPKINTDADFNYLFQLSPTKPQIANERSTEEQVETDYERALKNEITLAFKHNKVPHKSHTSNYESPLMMIHFWRIILDEVQMVSSTVSRAFQSASLISSHHRWGVSGTPIKKNLDDLLSTLQFLKFFPFSGSFGDLNWEFLIKSPKEFTKLWTQLSIRHTKAMVHDDIKLPPQSRILLSIPFNAVEQDQYNKKFEECLQDIGMNANGEPTIDDWELNGNILQFMRSWLNELRQLCSSPQIGKLHISNRKFLKNQYNLYSKYYNESGEHNGRIQTIDLLLTDMITKAFNEISELERGKIEQYVKLGEFFEFIYEPEIALTILKVGVSETERIIKRHEMILKKYNDKESFKSHVNTTSEEDISTIKMRIRNWLILLHKFYFLIASSNFQHYDPEFQKIIENKKLNDLILNYQDYTDYKGTERSNELTSIVSGIPIDEFHFEEKNIQGSYQLLEEKFYLLAEETREKILEPTIANVHKLIESKFTSRGWKNHVDVIGDYGSFEDDGTKLIPKSTKTFFGALPIITVDFNVFASTPKVHLLIQNLTLLIDQLNRQALCINEWVDELIVILCGPVLSSNTDPNGNEYEQTLNDQDKISSYLQILSESLNTRSHLIIGEATTNASINTTFNHTPFYQSLKQQLEKMTPTVKTELVEIISTLSILKPQMEANPIQLNLMHDMQPILQTVYENQKIANLLLFKELNTNCNAVFNARIDYYKQLQQISDTVRPPQYHSLDRDSLDPLKVKDEFYCLRNCRIDNNMDTAVARFRYLRVISRDLSISEENEDMNCVVCRSSIQLGSLTQCGHMYCKECLQQWLKTSNRCPMCKSFIHLSSVYNFSKYDSDLKAKQIDESPKPQNDALHTIYKSLPQETIDEIKNTKCDVNFCTKIDTIIRQVLYLKNQDPRVQIVIFSQWQDMLYLIASALKTCKISFISSYGTLTPNDAGTATRQRKSGTKSKYDSVESFKDPSNEITCFLLNAKADASGLTLVNAQHIFLCEPLVNTALELQAISRIHRIGQTKPTTVWMFSIENTIEESIIITSTNRRLQYLNKESTPDEKKISEAESLTMMGTGGEANLINKHGANQGELVTENDLWSAFFSSKLKNNELTN